MEQQTNQIVSIVTGRRDTHRALIEVGREIAANAPATTRSAVGEIYDLYCATTGFLNANGQARQGQVSKLAVF